MIQWRWSAAVLAFGVIGACVLVAVVLASCSGQAVAPGSGGYDSGIGGVGTACSATGDRLYWDDDGLAVVPGDPSCR